MRQSAKRLGLSSAALMLALLLVGTAVLAPCMVSAEDAEGAVLIQDPSGIRVEGFGEGEAVAPPLGSPGPGDILFKQPPYPSSSPDVEIWYADVSFGYRFFDDFWAVTGDIGGIHWYGVAAYPNSIYDCDPTGMEFEIVFCENAGGVPGAQVAVFSNVIPTRSHYDTIWSYTIYCFEVADLGTPVSLTEGWVSIESTYSPYGCCFAWINSPAGNLNAVLEPYTKPGNFWCLEENLAFALTEFTPPPPPNVKYLHSTCGLFNLTEPVGTQWHELLHIFGREYHLSSWEDNGDGILGYCDTIDMYEKPDGELRDYHVENVTVTLFVTPGRDRVGFGSNGLPPPMFIELEGGYNASVLTNPEGTQWHEIYPVFCTTYNLTDWDGDTNGVLDFFDFIWLRNRHTGEETVWLVEEVAIDIIVTIEPPPVGGEAYPVNKASLLAPWIAVSAILAGGISWYFIRRRRARG